MKTLITIRDAIKDFMIKYEKFVMPVVRFILTMLILNSFNTVMGYSAEASRSQLRFLISLICAFLPAPLVVLLVGAVGFLHMYAISLEMGAAYVVLFVLMYLLYMRFAPKYGWLIIVMPLLYLMKLHYIIPIIVGFFIGPAGIIPVAFGVIFYYYIQQVDAYYDMTKLSSAEESMGQGVTYIINGLMANKVMLLTIAVFAVVILITYFIYRQSFQYSWMIAIGASAVLSIVLFLMGGIVLELDIDIMAIFVGTVIGALLAVVAQFFKGILDYSRTENVQFEDDDYYYYVKAIPKIRVAERKIRVKKITDMDEDNEDEEDVRTRSSRSTTGTTARQGAADARGRVAASGAVSRQTQGSTSSRTSGTGTSASRVAGTGASASRTQGSTTSRTSTSYSSGTASARTQGAGTTSSRSQETSSRMTGVDSATSRTAGAGTSSTQAQGSSASAARTGTSRTQGTTASRGQEAGASRSQGSATSRRQESYGASRGQESSETSRSQGSASRRQESSAASRVQGSADSRAQGSASSRIQNTQGEAGNRTQTTSRTTGAVDLSDLESGRTYTSAQRQTQSQVYDRTRAQAQSSVHRRTTDQETHGSDFDYEDIE